MNRCRHYLPLLTAVVAALGCSPSLEVTGTYEPNLSPTTCAWDGLMGDKPLVAGSMNTAVARNYSLVLTLVNHVPATARDGLAIDQIELGYACKDTPSACAGFRAPKPRILDMVGFLPADGESTFLLHLFTEEAASALADWFPTDKPTTLVVSVKFHGVYDSGTTVESQALEFPIAVYSSPPAACPAGTFMNFPFCRVLFGLNGNDEYDCKPIQ